MTPALAEVDPRDPDALYALGLYYAELARRFPAGFEVARSRDPDVADLVRPRGAFILARGEGAPLGCVALNGKGGPVAEIKRLWVAPAARGLGLARRLMQAAEQAARELGVETLRLDTNKALPEAAALYRKTGWREIARFNDDPYAEVFFEKQL